MKNLIRMASAGAVVIVAVALFAGPAVGHDLNGSTLTCVEVSGAFTGFAANEHPIVWHVQVGGAPAQVVATTESPVAFVGSGTATAGITALTNQLNGVTGTVRAFATWPGGQSAVQSAELTCGVPVQVSAEVSEAPAAAAVHAAPAFTG